MKSMIAEKGVTFKELEKIFINGSVSLVKTLQKSFWNGMIRCWWKNETRPDTDIKDWEKPQ